MKANLGCGTDIIPGWDNVDNNVLVHDHRIVQCDLLDYLRDLPADYLDEVKAHHILEHVKDLDAVMGELHRTCVAGTTIDIIVPLANTLWDVADPSHVRRFNHITFYYYCDTFNTSYEHPRYFHLILEQIEREPNIWFEGIEWIVANLHVILKVVK